MEEPAFVFIWTGMGSDNKWTNPANWQKFSYSSKAPFSTGTQSPSSTEPALVFFGPARTNEVLVDSSQTVAELMFGAFYYYYSGGFDFSLKGTGSTTLTINNGLYLYSGYEDAQNNTMSDGSPGAPRSFGALAGGYRYDSHAKFDSTLKVALGGSQEWHVEDGLFDVFSVISDAPGITGNRLTLSGYGRINLYGNNTYGLGTGGGTDLAGYNWITVGVGSPTAFGSGKITFVDGSYATLATVNGDVTLANAVDVKSSQLYYAGEKGTLTLAGTVTLFDNPTHMAYVDSSGPAPLQVTGPIGQSGDVGVKLAFGGTGTVLLKGANTYPGGTKVLNGGVLLFGGSSSIPTTGSLTAASDGYIGALFTTGLQSNFIDRFDKAGTAGTIGFDTDPSLSGPNTLPDPISLAGFDAAARLGSATTTAGGAQPGAVLVGTITPQGTSYRFGGGGGTLEIASALVDQASPTAPRSVVADSMPQHPLTLRLKPVAGTNTYTGGTSATHSAIIFANANALPPSAQNFTLNSGGYIGLQLAADISDATATASPLPGFLGRFPTTMSNGYVGLDSIDRAPQRTITGLNLADFDGTTTTATTGFTGTMVRLATTTNINLTGNLTLPATASSVFLAGYKGGILNVSSALADGTGARSVVIGCPLVPATSGDAVLNLRSQVSLFGANTYTGGTTLNAGLLGVGSSTTTDTGGNIISGPLGKGALTVPVPSGWDLPPPSLSSSNLSGTVTLANNIVLNSDLNVEGIHDLALAGNISNGASTTSGLYKTGSFTLTLAGNNTFGYDYGPGLTISQGGVTFASNTAAGAGPLGLVGSLTPTATFTSTATAPVINGLFGDAAAAQLNLAPNSTLTINQRDDDTYRGAITGTGAKVVKDYWGYLRLEGASSYSGETWIKDGAIVAANNAALGTGPIRLGYPSEGDVYGGLLIGAGTTLTNPLYSAGDNFGYLGGFGTYAPTVRPVFGEIGTDRHNYITLSPGGDEPGSYVGQLNFGTAGVGFGPGGEYEIDFQHVNGSPGLGWDTLNIAGGLQITATPANPFTLYLYAPDPMGWETSEMPHGFNPMSAYSWRIASSTEITGYNPAAFVIENGYDYYTDGPVAAGEGYYGYYGDLNFGELLTSISSDQKNLFVNFSPARYWTGAAGKSWFNAANWRGKVVPPNDPNLTIVYFGSNRFGSVFLDSSLGVRSVKFGTVGSPSRYTFDATPGTVLTLGAGGISTDNYYDDDEVYANGCNSGLRAVFTSNLGLALAAPQTWQIDSGKSIAVRGVVSGAAANKLTLAGYGGLELSGANTYAGDTEINDYLHLGLGSNNALGGAGGTPGRVTVNGGVTFATTQGSVTLANAIDFKAYELGFEGNQGSLTLSNTVTLFQNAYLKALGPWPLIVTGSIVESPAASSRWLTLENGRGTVLLKGANTYSGGTSVYDGARLIFGTAAAIPSVPATSSLVAASNGYIGLGFVPADGNVQTAFLGKFNQAATNNGFIGFDSDSGPSTTNTFAGGVSLSGFSSGVRLSSATRAILSGAITPQGTATDPYRFGGGGGTLEVSGQLTGTRAVDVVSPPEQPLTLRLSNASATTPNNFTAGVNVTQSAIVFASSATYGSTSGNFTLGPGGYIGLQLPTATTDDATTIPGFLTRFSPVPTTGFIGFDSLDTARTITGLNLADFDGAGTGTAGFTGGSVGVATTTNLKLDGTLTLPTGATSYRFAGYKGGILTAASPLSGSNSVIIGDASVPATAGAFTGGSFVESVVKLTGANTYTGGTFLNNGRLVVGSAGALGTGSLTVNSGSYDMPPPTLEFGVTGLSLTNNFQFNGPVILDGGFNTTLTGVVSGGGYDLIKRGSFALTFKDGDNSGFYGRLVVQGGILNFNSAASFGPSHELVFEGAGGTVTFSAGSPTVTGLTSEPGVPATINLASGTALTVNNQYYSDASYHGVIAGTGASLVKEGDGILFLGGTNTYTGGTQINSSAVVAGNNAALGTATSMVTLGKSVGDGYYSYGTLAVGPGVVLANPLAITAGSLVGFGTFSPSARPAIGDRMTLAPGGAEDAVNHIGTLSFGSAGLEFASGGDFRLDIQDPFGVPGNGYDTLVIAGGLNITATPTGKFSLNLVSLGAYGVQDYLFGFDEDFSSFSLTIASASSISLNGTALGAGITNVSSLFAVNTSAFNYNNISADLFNVSVVNNALTVNFNFTPIPEPSTYALMLLGLGAVVFPALRRRRR